MLFNRAIWGSASLTCKLKETGIKLQTLWLTTRYTSWATVDHFRNNVESGLYEQKAVGASTGSLDHIRQNDSGTRKVKRFILQMHTQGHHSANKKQRPLKCNLGLVFFWSSLEECTDEPLVPWQGRCLHVHKRVCANMRPCVSMEYWLLLPIYFLG